jgi:hypothetical protein
VHCGIAHGDRVRARLKLTARNAVARFRGEIPQHAVGIDDVEIAAAAGVRDVAAMIREDRADRAEILRDRELRDEQDRIRNRERRRRRLRARVRVCVACECRVERTTAGGNHRDQVHARTFSSHHISV